MTDERIQVLLPRLTALFTHVFGSHLAGLYVHGSLAFGCFHWDTGDIDLLAAVDEPPELAEKVQLTEGLLALEGDAPPKGIEMSVLLTRDCRPFVYPTPFVLHYSPAHRTACRTDTEAFCRQMHGTDKDLAAHCTVLWATGFPLCGRAIGDVFGPVPETAYRDSLLTDLQDAGAHLAENPAYGVLNLCRVLAYQQEKRVLSKEQGGRWALQNLPAVYVPMIAAALEHYRTGNPFSAGIPAAQRFFADMMPALTASWHSG
ncbi:MAG: DUF4111 domain-containing protein [Acutalibacteraceae bacterium]